MTDDLISRQRVLNALGSITMYKGVISVDTAIVKIMQLPSVQLEIIRCRDCKYGRLDPSFPHQWFCKYKGDEWNKGDYFCGHARKREVTT